jgi:AcrR family transcriptional regulator
MARGGRVAIAGRRPKRGAPEETRARLVAAAARVFNRDGYHGTDSNRLAAAAGYAPGTFYKHFRDKRAIFLEAYERWVTSEWRAVEEVLRARGDADAAAARLVALVIRMHRRWRGLRASMLLLVATDAGAKRCYRRQRRRQLEILAALRQRFGLAPRQPEQDALLLFALERSCDALAQDEARALGLDRKRLEAGLRALVRDALG